MSGSADLSASSLSTSEDRFGRRPVAKMGLWVNRIVTWGMVIYLTIYCVEGPIRYVLSLAHADSAILGRDLFIDIPIMVLFVSQTLNHRVHFGLKLFLFLVALSSVVFYLNFGALKPIVFGIKVFINVALGLAAGHVLLNPSKLIWRFLALLFVVSVIGLVIEKFVFTFPWVGMHTVIAGQDVELSRDWMVQDEFSNRVGGFTRESIYAAGLLPILALIITSRCKALLLRVLILVVAVFATVLTTQKGAIAAITLVSVLMVLPRGARLASLRAALALGVISEIMIPFMTNGMVIAQSAGGVFSSSSFAQRIMTTWPITLRWIADHSIFPFGVGIGGSGGPLVSVAPGLWDFPDNMFLFCLADFGLLSIPLYCAMIYASWRSLRIDREIAEPALAIGTFVVFYGIVITIIEDQIMALALGGAIGMIFNAPLISRTVIPPRASPSNSEVDGPSDPTTVGVS